MEFCGTAAETDLKTLEIIQNDCLRIITGCRRTSPIKSLEVETNIPPLDIQRTEMVLKLYNRMRHLPSAVIAHCLLDDVDEEAIRDWTSSKAAPVAIRACTY